MPASPREEGEAVLPTGKKEVKIVTKQNLSK